MIANSPLLWLGITGLIVGGVLYFIFLPHIEGPNLREQEADQREWLVQCPNCARWRVRQPVSTNLEEQKNNSTSAPSYTNWYHCFECEHRWHEEYKL